MRFNFEQLRVLPLTALRPYKFPFKDLGVRAVYKNVIIIIITVILLLLLIENREKVDRKHMEERLFAD